MSRRNIDALRPIYAEWGRGNWQPRFAVYADDFAWGWSDEFPGLATPSQASEEVLSARLREWLSPWEDWRCLAEDYVASGDHVVVLTRYTGRGKGSRAEVDTRGAHLWTLRDGRAIRLEVFSSREKALAAAGIENPPTE
jgi:ketosteroid isomerase-like protein